MKIQLNELKQIINDELYQIFDYNQFMIESNESEVTGLTAEKEEWRRQNLYISSVIEGKKPYLFGQWKSYTVKNDQTGKYTRGWEALDQEIGIVRLSIFTRSSSQMNGRIKTGAGQTMTSVSLSGNAKKAVMDLHLKILF